MELKASSPPSHMSAMLGSLILNGIERKGNMLEITFYEKYELILNGIESNDYRTIAERRRFMLILNGIESRQTSLRKIRSISFVNPQWN